MSPKATFRFYEELNDFLPVNKKKTAFSYEFTGKPSVKDAIESIGIPHIEVDLILVNSESVTFSYHLKDGDMLSIYPVFESLDISNATHLRKKPLREPKFILDVHLGRLSKYLRMLGFDTLYESNYDDSTIIKTAREQKQTILTRDVVLLKNNEVTHGYWIRSQNSFDQAIEVIIYFDLFSSIKPFSRCILCNGIIQSITKESVLHLLKPNTQHYYDEFFQCMSCKKVYWKGSHYERMERLIEKLKITLSNMD
ncbi:Mut7-C RNAse domain-containing protein [Candidatus Latescibacterota bacterium]